jgi:hypothetical protein
MFLSYDTVEAFAVKRNPNLSFPFLKENGELLAICIESGFLVEPRALELYKDFYTNAFKFTECYPQFYRFTLALAKDIEKAGMLGSESQKIAEYVQAKSLVRFDTSDTRRLETLTLLSDVTGLKTTNADVYQSVLQSVDHMISDPNWYTKFNKPLFYELTHIIFFLSKNGTQQMPLKNDVYPCLLNMGVLSLLDYDADLLAEVCVCLKYIGRDIPTYWDQFLQKSLSDIAITFDGNIASALNPAVDEYHIYFVLNWYQALQNRPSFEMRFGGRTPSFSLPQYPESLLSKLSGYAHAYHFSNKKSHSIDSFVSHLEEHEFLLWDKAVNSVPNGVELTHKFSGLR